jgi:hypothetical protein
VSSKKDDKTATTAESSDGLQQYLSSVQKRVEARALSEQAKEEAEETHKELKKPQSEQTWLPFAPMPTDLCRVSPFFPLSQRQLKERPFLRNIVITKSAWGKITYSGPKLSTFEEDVLLALLALIDESKYRQETSDPEGRPTYTYRGPLMPILKLMGLGKVGKANYTRTIRALELMAQAIVKLELKSGSFEIMNMLTFVKWEDKKRELTVTINPYFYETYIGGSVTILDVLKRSTLSRPISKALYRFIMSHKEREWGGHFLTLAASLNLDIDQPQYQLRRQIKTAISDLKENGVLIDKCGFHKYADKVTLIRSHEAKPNRPKAEALITEK